VASKLSLFLALFVAGAVALTTVACGGPDLPGGAGRYRVAVLAHGIDPTTIPERYAADFDEDGQVDQLVVTDTSLQVLTSGGEEFSYVVGEPPWDPGEKIGDVRIFSFNRDGSYPSIVVATRKQEPGVWGTPATQKVVINEHGTLGLRSLWRYVVPAVSVDCAWIVSNDLPVCFYATYAVRPSGWGLSGLVEIDVDGWRNLLGDSAARGHVSRHLARRERFRDQTITRELVRSIWRLEAQEFDNILAAWDLPASASVVEVHQVMMGAHQEDLQLIFSKDLTRDYRLPFPALWPPYRLGAEDGLSLMGVRFFDFSGDGLRDLVAVGSHSRVFSAIQHEEGYFADAGYHSLRQEFLGVWAPQAPSGSGLVTPPCLYYVLERNQTWRSSDYLGCYDRAMNEWYEVELPEGVYFMDTAQSGSGLQGVESLSQRHYVPFWDMDEDGVIDFAARRDDGTWTAFTFVHELED
jgi:hypothetical protein